MACRHILIALVVSGVFLTIAGCAAPSDSALKHANSQFAAQNYGEAFNSLKDVVKYHDKRIEYALGYCYYYGYGTQPDPYHARYYISRSAWQLYMPAVKAMNLFTVPLPTFANIIRKSAPAPTLRHKRHAPIKRRVNTAPTRAKSKPGAKPVISAAAHLPAPSKRLFKQYRTAPYKYRPTHFSLPTPHSESSKGVA